MMPPLQRFSLFGKGAIMLEILVVVILCRRLGEKARQKGRTAGWFMLMLVGMWIFGELLGGVFAAAPIGALPLEPQQYQVRDPPMAAVADCAAGDQLAVGGEVHLRQSRADAQPGLQHARLAEPRIGYAAACEAGEQRTVG